MVRLLAHSFFAQLPYNIRPLQVCLPLSGRYATLMETAYALYNKEKEKENESVIINKNIAYPFQSLNKLTVFLSLTIQWFQPLILYDMLLFCNYNSRSVEKQNIIYLASSAGAILAVGFYFDCFNECLSISFQVSTSL